jgi:four helix bundle protein
MDNEQGYKPRDMQKRTFMFGVRIVKLVDRLPRSLAAIEIGRQLLRAGTSVGANVREADRAESHKDFVHKITIAEKEAKEAHYCLELLRESVLQNDTELTSMLDESDQLGRILYAIGRCKKN